MTSGGPNKLSKKNKAVFPSTPFSVRDFFSSHDALGGFVKQDICKIFASQIGNLPKN